MLAKIYSKSIVAVSFAGVGMGLTLLVQSLARN